jgi:serine-threonine kinase receptor-associated protein
MASEPRQYHPLTCHGHSRPVPHIAFSAFEKENEKEIEKKTDSFFLISACKGASMSCLNRAHIDMI